MNELYIHFPGERVASIDDLDRLGYSAYVDRSAAGEDICWSFFDDIATDPHGENGSLAVLSAWDGIPPHKPVVVDLETQHWITTASEWDAEAAPAYLGYRRDFPPTPHSLRRRMLMQGTDATLGGEQWKLPNLIRIPLRGLDAAGELVDSPVTAADRLAHRLARDFYVGLRPKEIRTGDPNFCPVGSRAIVEYALARNYRGDWRLWESLGLFDGAPVETAVAMLHAIGVVGFLGAQDGGLV